MKSTEHPKIIFQNNNRFLVPIERTHLANIQRYRNAQMAVLRQFKPLTEGNQERWFEKISEDPTQAIFGLLVKKAKEYKLVGYCGLTNIDYRNQRAELSFLVDPTRASNHKLYKEDFIAVLEMICQYGFKELNLHKIFSETFSFRKFHIHVLESFGFYFEGTMRDHTFTDGKYYDSLLHSILASEWRKKNKTKVNLSGTNK